MNKVSSEIPCVRINLIALPPATYPILRDYLHSASDGFAAGGFGICTKCVKIWTLTHVNTPNVHVHTCLNISINQRTHNCDTAEIIYSRHSGGSLWNEIACACDVLTFSLFMVNVYWLRQSHTGGRLQWAFLLTICLMYCLETYLKTAHRKQIFRTVYLTSYAMQGARPTSTSTWTSVPSSSAINFVYTQIKYRRKYTIADIAQLATQIGTTKRKYANWLGKFLSLHFIYIYIILMFTQWILYVTMFTHVTYDYGNGRFWNVYFWCTKYEIFWNFCLGHKFVCPNTNTTVNLCELLCYGRKVCFFFVWLVCCCSPRILTKCGESGNKYATWILYNK